MKSVELAKDNTLAAMTAWNTISELLGEDEDSKFDDLDKFSSFYKLFVSKLHENEGENE